MPSTNYKRTVEPVENAVRLDRLKAHLHIDNNLEHDELLGYLRAAVDWVEDYLRRQLITASYQLKLDAFPACGVLELPHPPLRSVTGIQYVDPDGVTQTLSTSVYEVDTHAEPGRVLLKYGESWPSVRPQENAVSVTFTAGYGDDPEDVPEKYRQAIQILAGHYYRNRDEGGDVPPAVLNLLRPTRVY